MRHASIARADRHALRASHVAQARQTARVAQRAAAEAMGELGAAPLSPVQADHREVILSRLADALSVSRTIAEQCAAAGAADGPLRSVLTFAQLQAHVLRLNAAVGTLARITTGEIRLHTAALDGTD